MLILALLVFTVTVSIPWYLLGGAKHRHMGRTPFQEGIFQVWTMLFSGVPQYLVKHPKSRALAGVTSVSGYRHYRIRLLLRLGG